MIHLTALTFTCCSSACRMLRFLPVPVLLFFICVLSVPIILLRPVQADDLAPSAKKPDSRKPVLSSALDDDALKAAIARRIRMGQGNKDERYKQFGPERVAIEEARSVHIRGTAFYAVKIRIHHPAEAKGQEVITLIVDKTGTLQISGVYDLATGNNVMQDAVNQLQHVDVRDLPPDFGKEVFTGDGGHTVTAVSDPFCPHCRKGWEYIKLHQDRINTYNLVHFPLNPAAEAACMVMADAHHRQFNIFDIVDFAYTRLHSDPDPQKILTQFMAAFPELAEKWGHDPGSALTYLTQTYGAYVRKERNDARALGISSTPVFFVNDTYIRGFNAQKMDTAMP